MAEAFSPVETVRDYHSMRLSTAMAISGAAVANKFGTYSDQYPAPIRFLLTLSVAFFNFGLGLWVTRPDGGHFGLFERMIRTFHVERSIFSMNERRRDANNNRNRIVTDGTRKIRGREMER